MTSDMVVCKRRIAALTILRDLHYAYGDDLQEWPTLEGDLVILIRFSFAVRDELQATETCVRAMIAAWKRMGCFERPRLQE